MANQSAHMRDQCKENPIKGSNLFCSDAFAVGRNLDLAQSLKFLGAIAAAGSRQESRVLGIGIDCDFADLEHGITCLVTG